MRPQAEPNSTEEGPALSYKIQQELIRLGCASGDAEDNWGKTSRAAVGRFNRHAKASLDPDEPSSAIDGGIAQPWRARLPAGLRARTHAQGDTCVAIERAQPRNRKAERIAARHPPQEIRAAAGSAGAARLTQAPPKSESQVRCASAANHFAAGDWIRDCTADFANSDLGGAWVRRGCTGGTGGRRISCGGCRAAMRSALRLRGCARSIATQVSPCACVPRAQASGQTRAPWLRNAAIMADDGSSGSSEALAWRLNRPTAAREVLPQLSSRIAARAAEPDEFLLDLVAQRRPFLGGIGVRPGSHPAAAAPRARSRKVAAGGSLAASGGTNSGTAAGAGRRRGRRERGRGRGLHHR